MQISPESRQKIQLVLTIAVLVTALRTGYILYERSAAQKHPARKLKAGLNPDYYVTPKKLYPYDLKSARELTKMPVWVKEGYRYTCYPYDPAKRRSDFAHEAGLLLPIEKLQVKEVLLDISPGSPGQQQVMAVFERAGKSYAFPIGYRKGDDVRVYSDEMLFIQDPRQLYQHWPADVWDSIEKHEAKPGMNEMQILFAIGMGTPEAADDPAVLKVVKYPNGGRPLTVIYRNGNADEIKPGR